MSYNLPSNYILGESFHSGLLVNDNYNLSNRQRSYNSDERTEPIKFNMSCNEKTGRYFVGVHGHVFSADSYQELVHIVSNAIIGDVKMWADNTDGTYFTSETKYRLEEVNCIDVVPGLVRVKTRHGKKAIKDTVPVNVYLASDLQRDVMKAVEPI